MPNLLTSGILAILFSLLFLVWATLFVQRKHRGLILMLLVGGGIGPPLLSLILGAAATRIDTPLTWWRAHLPVGPRHLLGQLWPLSFSAGLIAWLCLLPDPILRGHFFGVDNPNLIYSLHVRLSFSEHRYWLARDVERQAA